MHHRSSSAPSLRRVPDVPFVTREVFRLVLRLEAQKALDVNVAALEQHFHVPSGYADDDELDARGEKKGVKNQWTRKEATAMPTAAFLSKTVRDPFTSSASHCALIPQATSAAPPSPTERAIANGDPGCFTDDGLRIHTANPSQLAAGRASKSPRSRLRLPGALSLRDRTRQLPDDQHEQQQPELLLDGLENAPGTSSYSSMCSQHATVFPRVGRQPDVNKETVPAVGTYDIKRLWDPTATSRASIGAPSPAVFGASREKRVVTWRPAFTPPSYTVSTSWDSSQHYAKQKQKVVRSAAKRRLQRARRHARSLSTPTLRPSTASQVVEEVDIVAGTGALKADADDDPFSWLCQLPNGEHRVNLLAAKHGLIEHVKNHTRRGSIHDTRQSMVSQADNQTNRDDKPEDVEDLAAAPSIPASKQKDGRIMVSCRLPGGMLISAHIYSARKLRNLKAAVLRRQSRFHNADQFDLYHTSGRKLTALNDSLVACGIHDRSLLQIVPAVAIAVAPQGPSQAIQA
ncbi:hypothetical protein BBJ28_00006254 [Nothophytophthora sp. Chile5]|nr:hypothetical protein BBJ28_00006254 [Nothophytophthora sp. Chile5]